MSILNYNFQAMPNPMPVSKKGILGIRIEKNDKGVGILCQEIEIAIPMGTEEAALFENVADVDVSTSDSENWECGKNHIAVEEDEKKISYLVIHLRPKTVKGAGMEQPASFCVTGTVIEAVGEVQISIKTTFESSEEEIVSYKVEKGEGDFYLRNFLARKSEGDSFPCAEFKKGQPIYLSWQGNGSWYEVYASGNSTPIIETAETCCCMEQGICEDTTFILKAIIADFAPLQQFAALTVHVINPDLEELEIKSLLSGKTAKTELLGNAKQIAFPDERKLPGCTVIADTDGYIIGTMEFEHGVTGAGSIKACGCQLGESERYEMEGNALQGDLCLTGNTSMYISQKASVCMPVAGNVPITLSYLVSSISVPEKYSVKFWFVPFGEGKVQII